MQSEVADKDKQLRIMTDQNSELLRLLESEESLTTQLQGEVTEFRAELDELRQKHSTLLFTAKTHEELATKAAKEGQLRAEEIRLLRVEGEQLKQQNTGFYTFHHTNLLVFIHFVLYKSWVIMCTSSYL